VLAALDDRHDEGLQFQYLHAVVQGEVRYTKMDIHVERKKNRSLF
jgi:hypothetical protein